MLRALFRYIKILHYLVHGHTNSIMLIQVCALYITITSDMQGMVWGEPERGSAQNCIWKRDGDDSSQDSISSVSIASVYSTESC